MKLSERFDKIYDCAAGIESLMDCLLKDGNQKNYVALAQAAREWAEDVVNLSDSTSFDCEPSATPRQEANPTKHQKLAELIKTVRPKRDTR